jgi:hypothetical protein
MVICRAHHFELDLLPARNAWLSHSACNTDSKRGDLGAPSRDLPRDFEALAPALVHMDNLSWEIRQTDDRTVPFLL